MSDQSTLLARGLASYKYRDAARTDIESASAAYHSLLVKLQDFTFENGQTSKLLCLEGTIPVRYMGNVYNIPLAVYFVYQHPYHPPIAYVRPTSSMQIKPGPNVDTNGKIFHPYLSEWEFPGSTTQQLLGILQSVFSSRTPVFSKTTANHNPPGYVGFSGGVTSPNGSAYGASGVGWGGMPGLPVSTTSPPVGTSRGMPSMPSSSSTSNFMGAATSSASMMSEEDQLLLSLRSALLDKFNKERREMLDSLSCETQSLESTERELISRATNFDTIRAQMISELDQVRSLTRELKDKTKEYEEAYRKLEEGTNTKDYDSIVTTAPVYRQLSEAFAEEQAIGDVLYYLSQALEHKAIPLDVFLEVVRKQSQDQFLKRATVYKCRAKAGLPSI